MRELEEELEQFQLPPLQVLDYKKIRSREICEMALAHGHEDKCEIIIAHQQVECGTMSEWCDWQPHTSRKWTNDNGWAFGLWQWHIFYRHNQWLKDNNFAYRPGSPEYAELVRHQFFKDHPEMTTWQGQAERYMNELDYFEGDIWKMIRRWNSAPDYVQKVKNNIPRARELLTI